MTEELIVALVDRIKAGDDRESLRKEVLAAGYDLHEFQAAYAEAARRLGVTDTPSTPPIPGATTPMQAGVAASTPQQQTVPDNLPTDEPVAAQPAPTVHQQESDMVLPTDPVVPTNSPLSGASSLSAPAAKSGSHLPLIIIGGVVVLLIGSLVLWMTMFGGQKFLSSLFGNAPYAQDTFLTDLTEGVAQIESAGYKVSFSAVSAAKDADTYLLPSELAFEDSEELAALLAFIPSDLDISGSLTGQVAIDDSAVPNFYTRLEGAYATDDFSMFADAEVMLLKDDGVFVRINRMPSMFFFDIASIKGEWLHVFAEALDLEDMQAFQEEVMADSESQEQMEKLLEIGKKHQVFTLEGLPQKGEVNDQVAYKYTIVLNHAALNDFFAEAETAFAEAYGPRNIISEFADQFGLERFVTKAYVDYFNTHYKFVLWARTDGIPVRYGVEARVAIDDDFDLEMLGRADAADFSTQVNTAAVVSRAKSDFVDAATYDGFCESESFDSSFYEETGAQCTSNSDGFAVSAFLSDGSSFCIDQTSGRRQEDRIGQSGECVPYSKPAVANDSEPREAERQLNISFYIDLLNVNETITLEVPEGALSAEEISERNPMIGELVSVMQDRSSSARVPNVPTIPGRPGELTEARDTTRDAGAKQMLSSARAEAEISYDNNNRSYAQVCTDTASLWEDEPVAGQCTNSAAAYIIEAELSAGGYFCVDSTGAAQESMWSVIENGVPNCGACTEITCGE